MWAKHDTTARTRTPAITTMCGQITKTHCAIDAAVRRSIAARVRAIDAPVVNDESSIDWAQNPAPEQHESPGNVATQCHFVPRIKHVAEARKPNSPLHLRKKTAPDQGPGQHAQKKHPVYSRMYSVRKRPTSGGPPESIATLSIARSAGWPSAPTWCTQAIAALVRNAAPEPVRVTAMPASLKSLSRDFSRDQAVNADSEGTRQI